MFKQKVRTISDMKRKYKKVKVNGQSVGFHRLVMQEHLGRNLNSFEHVYHLNGNPSDNSIENLVVIIKKSRAS